MRFTVAVLALVLVGPFASWASRVRMGSSRPNPRPVPLTAFHGESSETPDDTAAALDDTAAAPDDTDANQEVAELTLRFEEGVEASESFAELNTSETEVVKLMVVWTKAFECKRLNNVLNKEGSRCTIGEDSKKAAVRFINKAFAKAQLGFIDSKINATLKFVYRKLYEDYMEDISGGLVSELSRLNGCKIDGLCDLRKRTGAHIVAAFTDNTGSGVARYGPSARMRSAAIGRGASDRTLNHMIGILFGCQEDEADCPGKMRESLPTIVGRLPVDPTK